LPVTPPTAAPLTDQDVGTLTDAELEALRNPALDSSAVDAPEQQSGGNLFRLYVFVIVPLLAVVAAIPLAWGGFIGPVDVALLVGFYFVTAAGITVGFHRYFTHGAFKAKPWMRVALAIAGTLAIEGPVDRWVADHRKHHAFSDKEGDPHSPWRFGETVRALMKGLFYAHMGWLFDIEQTARRKYCPDLLDDASIQKVARAFPGLVLVSVFLPAVIGGLVTWSWWGALTGFFWGGLVRIALVHHITWSINSICHVMGEKPFKSRDRSGNVWWLAIPSLGESWHNLHHADPTCARHGVEKGQIDISARLIWLYEKAGWVYDVRWPKQERLDSRRAS
jgi:stearoyl-CoA desaturase (delta-9 desaturase)